MRTLMRPNKGRLDMETPTESEKSENQRELTVDTDDLALRLTLARRRTIQDATEMDLMQYLMSRGGDA